MGNNVYKHLREALETLEIELRKEGDFLENEELPDELIIYDVISTNDSSFSSNKNAKVQYRVQVSFWSRDESLTEEANELLDSVLKPLGYIKISGRPLPLWKASQHYGWSNDYRIYMED